MVFTKYAYLREEEEAFNASVLRIVPSLTPKKKLYHIYVVPMIIDTTNIRQVKISLEPVLKGSCDPLFFFQFSYCVVSNYRL